MRSNEARRAAADLELDADVPELGIELERVQATFSADAGLLGAAEGRAEVAQEPAVDPDHADLELGRDALGARDVAGEKRGAEAVAGVVGALDRLLLAVEGGDVAARTEDLLAHDRGVLREAGPDRGLDPGAALELARHLEDTAARHDARALGGRPPVEGKDLLAVLQADHRAHRGRGVVRLARL